MCLKLKLLRDCLAESVSRPRFDGELRRVLVWDPVFVPAPEKIGGRDVGEKFVLMYSLLRLLA